MQIDGVYKMKRIIRWYMFLPLLEHKDNFLTYLIF